MYIMKNIRKTRLAFLLAICMIIALLPAAGPSALAVPVNDYSIKNSFGTTSHPYPIASTGITLAEGDTITFLKPLDTGSLDVFVPEAATIVNGISGPNNSMGEIYFFINEDNNGPVSVTMTDINTTGAILAEDANIKFTGENKVVPANDDFPPLKSSGEVTLDASGEGASLTLTAQNDSDGYTSGIHHIDGTLTLDGDITATGFAGITVGYVSEVGPDPQILVGGDLQISGGNVTATGDIAGIEVYGGDVFMSGGTADISGGMYGLAAGYFPDHEDGGNVTITGGTLSAQATGLGNLYLQDLHPNEDYTIAIVAERTFTVRDSETGEPSSSEPANVTATGKLIGIMTKDFIVSKPKAYVEAGFTGAMGFDIWFYGAPFSSHTAIMNLPTLEEIYDAFSDAAGTGPLKISAGLVNLVNLDPAEPRYAINPSYDNVRVFPVQVNGGANGAKLKVTANAPANFEYEASLIGSTSEYIWLPAGTAAGTAGSKTGSVVALVMAPAPGTYLRTLSLGGLLPAYDGNPPSGNTTDTTPQESTLTSAQLDDLFRSQGNNILYTINSPANEIRISVPLSWFANHRDVTVCVYVPGLGVLKINGNTLLMLAAQATPQNGSEGRTFIEGIGYVDLNAMATFVLQRGSLKLSAQVAGKSISWYLYDSPVTVGIPYKPEDGVNSDNVVMFQIMDDGSEKIIARSRLVEGTVYALVNGEGHFDAKVNKVSFTDIAGGWMEEAVNFVSARSIMNGIGNDLFDAAGEVTRAQYVTMMIRMINYEPTGSWMSGPFADQDDIPEWAVESVAKAKAAGILTDIVGDDENFRPNEPITRQDMFVVTYSALEMFYMLNASENEDALDEFSDAADVSDYALTAMRTLVEADLVHGASGQLNPENTSTRAEAAQFMTNVLKYLVDKPEAMK